MILKMAYRNIFRHKQRTVLTLVAIVFGIYLAIFGDGMNAGMERDIINIYKRTEIGDFKIYQEGFHTEREDNEQLEYLIKNEAEVFDALKNHKYTARLNFPGNIIYGADETSVNFLGVDPVQEDEIFDRSSSIQAGGFSPGDRDVVIGSGLAELLGLKVGDEVTITARTATKSINAYDVNISGIIKTGNPLLDGKIVFTGLKFAKEFTLAGKVNDIVVLGDEKGLNNLDKLNVEIVGWEKETEDLINMTKMKRKGVALVSLIILIMAGVSIANTMIMVMMERQKEIGIMMAGGMSRRSIMALFFSEGMIVGTIGSGLGTLLGSVTVLYYEKEGIAFGIENLGLNLPVNDRIFTYLDVKVAAAYMITGLVISLVATLYPAYKATKYDPVEILRD
jgi:putative ABC transport system permease protein